MGDELKDAAMGLYKPPFRYEYGYIFDAEGQMVADEAGEHITQVRGWGRISYMKDPEALQDTVGEIVAAALTEFWQRHATRPPEETAK